MKLNDEQQMLQDSVARLMADKGPVPHLRELRDRNDEKGYDEPLYAGSFWAPPTEDPEQPMRHGDYIHWLRRRRKWTMSR